MAQQWVAVLTRERYAEERLYARDTVAVAGSAPPGDVARVGDPVALLAAGDPTLLVALGRVQAVHEGTVAVRYTHRLFDEPMAVPAVAGPDGLTPLDEAAYRRLSDPVGAAHRVDADRAAWLVTLALPIEASSAAEAVREFWTYVDKLGPRELPAFVWRPGEELAMQAFVLGDEATLDPED
jgi:hypothetical protein